MDYTQEIKDKLRRYNELDTEFNNGWRQHAMELSRFLLPRQGRFLSTDRNKGVRRHNNIIDNTGTNAVRVLAAGLMGGANSPARPWFRLTVGDAMLAKSDNVKRWLSETTEAMHNVFRTSNFYRAIHTMYEELAVFGTAAALVLPDFDDVIRIYPFTYGEYRIATNHRGEVDCLAREFDRTVTQVVDEFGFENCSKAVQNMYNNKNYAAWVTIIHIIEPNRNRDASRRDNQNMPYLSCYFEKGSNEGKYLRRSGFQRFRVLAPRWHVTGSDEYGQSVGMEGLGDVKSLQHEQLKKAQAIDYQVEPPLSIPTTMKHRELNRLPGGTSYMDATSDDAIKTLFSVNLNLQHLREDIMDVRARIRQTFYTDMFLMMANDTRSGITATEVAERHEEKLLMLGPVLERLHNELHAKVIDLVFEDMLEAGLIPPAPEELQGQALSVDFVSMLAQAQRAVAIGAVDRYVMSLGALVPVIPDIMDNFDSDYYADHVGDLLGIDPKLIRADVDRDAIREGRAQMQQQAAQMQQVEQAAKAAQALGNTPTDTNNALVDAVGMFSGYTNRGA